jgi:hypothetical protein
LAVALLIATVVGCTSSSSSPSASGGGGSNSAAARLQSMENLKQIGAAFHAYEKLMGVLPTAGTTKDNIPNGKPLLSWRVAILPYIEQQQLYDQFKHDEPWDSPHNKKLLAHMPKLYVDPRYQRAEDKPDVCYYRGFVGLGTVLGQPGGVGRNIITNANGTANTILLVEASEPVQWTRPDELVFDSQKPLPPLGGPKREDFLALFCDGHVQRLPANIPEQTLRCAINWQNNTAFVLP